MPRTARGSVGGYTYHVVNRGNARSAVFHKSDDYHASVEIVAEPSLRVPMGIRASRRVPDRFVHLALRPRDDGDLSRSKRWLPATHVRRYLRHYYSSDQIRQSRFKVFPIEGDKHLLTVLQHIERNP